MLIFIKKMTEIQGIEQNQESIEQIIDNLNQNQEPPPATIKKPSVKQVTEM